MIQLVLLVDKLLDVRSSPLHLKSLYSNIQARNGYKHQEAKSKDILQFIMMQRVVFFLLALCRVSNAFVVIDPMVGRQFQHTKIMTPTVVEASIAEGANGKY